LKSVKKNIKNVIEKNLEKKSSKISKSDDNNIEVIQRERCFIDNKVDRIDEEQNIVNKVLDKIDDMVSEYDEKKKDAIKKIEYAKDSSAEAYGMLVENRYQMKNYKKAQSDLKEAKKTLYKSRLKLKINDLEVSDDDRASEDNYDKIITNSVLNNENTENEVVEILVGEHECGDYLNRIVYSWLNPICRNYVLVDNTEDYVYKNTKYSLEFKRDIVLMNKRVVEVIDKYPIVENADDSIYTDVADPFLKMLENKRGQKEMSNIIFSIQKQQTKIVMVPYDKNIIVQGCAGSGKTMIMLHRLPVLLYDNKKQLFRKQVAVITPSQLYIKMANKLLEDLEIEDIYMDVANEYYSSRIDLYEGGIYKREIPKNTSRKIIDKKIYNYVHSRKIEKIISDYFEENKNRINDVMKEVYSITKDDDKTVLSSSDMSIKEMWRKYSVYLLNILKQEDKKHEDRKKYVKVLIEKSKELYTHINGLCEKYTSALQKKESLYNNMIYKKEHSKRQLLDKNGEKAKTYKRYIGYEEDIENYMYIRNEVQKAIDSLSENILLRKQVEFYAEHLEGILKEYDSESELSFLEEDFIINNIFRVITALKKVKFINKEQAEEFKCINKCLIAIDKVSEIIDKMQSLYGEDGMYSANDYLVLTSAYEDVKYMSEVIVQEAYEMVIDELRFLDDALNTTVRYEFTYYLYLQIIYRYSGKLQEGYDKLVLIDEAQNFSLAELDLINNVNGGVIFNLFGDINQHIELEKGLNIWEDISNRDEYEYFELNQNYRNVSQITEYCNSRFDMDMQPVNLEGKDVYTYNKSDVDVVNLLNKVYKEKKEDYSMAFIVKSIKDDLKDIDMSSIDNLVNKVRNRRDHIDNKKINIIEVDSAKGIEFDVVVVMQTVSMSRNEEYIACTRALEQLVIYSYFEKADIYTTRENHCINEINDFIQSNKLESAKSRLGELFDKKNKKYKERVIDTLFARIIPNKYANLLAVAWTKLSDEKFSECIGKISNWLVIYKDDSYILKDVLNDMKDYDEQYKYSVLSDEITTNNLLK